MEADYRDPVPQQKREWGVGQDKVMWQPFTSTPARGRGPLASLGARFQPQLTQPWESNHKGMREQERGSVSVGLS